MIFDGFLNNRPILIAEIGQAHEGSLGIALSYIDLAKQAGADFVKFQTHIANEESSIHEPWRKIFSKEDHTRLDYWKRMEFTEREWLILSNHAKEIDIGFISSPFSSRAVQILENINVPFYKIASGEIHNTPMLECIKKTKKPVVISTGLSHDNELKSLVNFFEGTKICILHCVSEYPTTAENTLLSRIPDLVKMFPDCGVGISDHSGTIYPTLLSLHNNLKIVELHLTFNKKIFGPDTTSSLCDKEFRLIREGIDFYAKSKLENYDFQNKDNMKKIFGRSAFLRSGIFRGQALTKDNILMKKPGGGMTYEEAVKLIGKLATIDINNDEFLKTELFS
jgi:N,N'-diacetyllegionaminate synthase